MHSKQASLSHTWRMLQACNLEFFSSFLIVGSVKLLAKFEIGQLLCVFCVFYQISLFYNNMHQFIPVQIFLNKHTTFYNHKKKKKNVIVAIDSFCCCCVNLKCSNLYYVKLIICKVWCISVSPSTSKALHMSAKVLLRSIIWETGS